MKEVATAPSLVRNMYPLVLSRRSKIPTNTYTIIEIYFRYIFMFYILSKYFTRDLPTYSLSQKPHTYIHPSIFPFFSCSHLVRLLLMCRKKTRFFFVGLRVLKNRTKDVTVYWKRLVCP